MELAEIPHVRDDLRYIESILRGQLPEVINAALEDYKVVWEKAASKEPVGHKKQNVGRRAANIFLRTVVWPSLINAK